MNSSRLKMVATMAAFSLAGAGAAVALLGQLPLASASTSGCPTSISTSVTTTHHASAGSASTTGAPTNGVTNQGAATNGNPGGNSGTNANAGTDGNGQPTDATPLVTVNAGANGSSNASNSQAPSTSGGNLVTVNTNTSHAGTPGLVKSLLGSGVNAVTQRGGGHIGINGVNGLSGTSGLLNGSGLLGGVSINGDVNASSSTDNN
jgi:hypothetical protein